MSRFAGKRKEGEGEFTVGFVCSYTPKGRRIILCSFLSQSVDYDQKVIYEEKEKTVGEKFFIGFNFDLSIIT